MFSKYFWYLWKFYYFSRTIYCHSDAINFQCHAHGPRSACIKFQNWWRERVRCKAVRAVFCPLSPPQFGMRASRKDMILDSFFSKIQNLEKKKKKEKMKADRAYL